MRLPQLVVFSLGVLAPTFLCLPVPAPPTTEVSPDCDSLTSLSDAHYRIHLDQFVDHITTHWKYDHLDRIQQDIIQSTSQLIQEQIQMSLITTPGAYDQQQQQIILQSDSVSTIDTMDTHILIAQIKDAVQAHTRSRLPVAWDDLGDELSKMSLMAYLHTLITDQCVDDVGLDENFDGDDDSDEWIAASCLSEHADQLSASLDHYLGTHLLHLLDTLDKVVLPDLLLATKDDLADLVSYFNHVFFDSSSHQLQLEVLPWATSVRSAWIDNLLPRLDQDIDDTSHYFTKYACLAKMAP
ncbi:hypothetical protein BC940DRAFT_289587 [Gongronella butleri]|nr:hypothetical protein BC940DRAFT_289587 [Gongronella butleri]